MVQAQGGCCRLNAAKNSSTSDGFVRSTRMKGGEHVEQVGHILFLSCKDIDDGWCMRWNFLEICRWRLGHIELVKRLETLKDLAWVWLLWGLDNAWLLASLELGSHAKPDKIRSARRHSFPSKTHVAEVDEVDCLAY